MPNAFLNQTPEQQAANRAKGLETRRRKSAERAASPLRRDFKDNAHWEELSRRYELPLAPWGEAPTPDRVKFYLRKYGITMRAYLDWFGEGNVGSFAKLNPDWPLRALTGILLEQIASGGIVRTR